MEIDAREAEEHLIWAGTPRWHYPQTTLPTPPPSSPAPVAGSSRKRPIIINDDEDNALRPPAKKTFLGFVDLSHDEDEEENLWTSHYQPAHEGPEGEGADMGLRRSLTDVRACV
ncbi:hypothetical protein C8J57DRAFT_1516866 [Mycena rebaudengoi]|nr:hypothetical protein C8J57DRAFT_1516866 [Mycena rebaudengoi]